MTIDSGALDMAFRTALLLTGSTKTAEEAVIHGIGSCEELSHRALLMETVRSVIRRRTKPADGPYDVESLPTELRCLFTIQPLLRECFVLRILVGLSPRICAELLDISIIEFEDAIFAALNQLPLLVSFKPAHYAQE